MLFKKWVIYGAFLEFSGGAADLREKIVYLFLDRPFSR